MRVRQRALGALFGLGTFAAIGALISWSSNTALRSGVGIGVGFGVFLGLSAAFRRRWPPTRPEDVYPRAWPLVLAGALAGLSAALVRGMGTVGGAVTGAAYALAYVAYLWLEKHAPVGRSA